MSLEDIALEILKLHTQGPQRPQDMMNSVTAYNYILKKLYEGRREIFSEHFDKEVEDVLGEDGAKN